MAITQTYLVTEQQSIFDLCVIIYGSLDKIVKLMNDNNLSIDTYIPAGTRLVYDNSYTPNPTRITTANYLWAPPTPVVYPNITGGSVLYPSMYYSYYLGTVPASTGTYSFRIAASTSFVSTYGITGSWTNSNIFHYLNESSLLAGGTGITISSINNTTMTSKSVEYGIPYTPTVISFNQFAGTGSFGYNGNFATFSDGALRAQLNFPTGIAYSPWDAAIYFSDSLNYRIRAIGSGIAGNIVTVSGNGSNIFGGATGPASSATWTAPTAMYFDSGGNCYICDENANRVRKFDTFFNMSVFAGTNSSGFSGDGGLAISAKLNIPGGICGNSASDIFIADRLNARIRKVSGGIITTYAGSGVVGYAGDGLGATNSAVKINIGAVFTSTGVITMGAMACNTRGDLYFCDSQNHCIRKINATTKIITTVLGNPTGVVSSGIPTNGASASNSRITQPTAITIDSNNNIYVAHNSKFIIKFTDGGVVNTLFNIPTQIASGMCVDPLNNVYITDANFSGTSNRIFKYSPATSSTTDIYILPNYTLNNTTHFSSDSAIQFKDGNSNKAINVPIIVLQGSGASASFVKDYLIGSLKADLVSTSGLTATVRLTKSHNTPNVNLVPSTKFINQTAYPLTIDPFNPTSSDIRLVKIPIGTYYFGVETTYYPPSSTFSYGTSFINQVVEIRTT